MDNQIKIGFVGFGEVNSPRPLIERKCRLAVEALQAEGLQVFAAGPVSDEPDGGWESRARQELASTDFDLLVVCLAGWIPSHSVIDVISPFQHKPMVLWGLTGEYIDGRLVTTADQAGTTALRHVMKQLGFRFSYVYDTPNAPYAGAKSIRVVAEAAHAARRLRSARVGMMGWRDMKLHATLYDGMALRRELGVEIETFEMLEIAQRMAAQPSAEISRIAEQLIQSWVSDKPLTAAILEPSIRLYLAVMEQVRLRGYEAISLIDVDGVKKLMGFTPAAAMMMLSDLGGLVTIPENDALGSVTQLIVRYLTGQCAHYMEFYEFFEDRVLIGVPDYVPAAVTDGRVQVRLTKFGNLSEGVLNVSRVKTGKVTLCRLFEEDGSHKMHVVTGEAVSPPAWEEAGWEPPAPQLPSLSVLLDVPVKEFAQKVTSQHTIVAYGDQRERVETFCRLAGIGIV